MSNNNTEAKEEILTNRICGRDTRHKLVKHRAYTCCPMMGNKLPEKNICGQRGPSFRIVRGKQANLNEFPWMAMLLYKKRGSSDPRLFFKCGGSLITNRYVLTASHCIRDQYQWELKKVRLGEHERRSDHDCVQLSDKKKCAPPHLDIYVEEIILHVADIALLRLKKPVRYTNEIKPICLPPAHIDLKNEDLVVAGWGQTENGKLSKILKQAFIMENTRYCENSRQLMFDSKTQICAGGQGGRDTCYGDSGGPLMASSKQGHDEFLYVAGITSYGPLKCGEIGVYTKTGVYFNWIMRNLKP
nr:spaetzle-processing enzyme-like [Drosophila takahashii]